MNEALLKYFASHHYLLLPGIGSIRNLYKEPSLDFVNRQITPAQQQLAFNANEEVVDEKLVHFLSTELMVDETVAEENLRAYAYGLQLQLLQNNEVTITGIGTLRQKNNLQEIVPATTISQLFPTLAAERITRKNNEHTVRIGEQHINSASLKSDQYKHPSQQKDRWWVAAVIILALTVGGALLFLLRDKLF